MDTVATIINDWIMLSVALIHATFLAWITYTPAQKKEATERLHTAKSGLLRVVKSATSFSVPSAFVVSLAFAPWPPSRFSLSLIIVSGLLVLWRALLPLILRVWKSSLDAQSDYNEWHRMHFVLLHELLTSGTLTDAQVQRINAKITEIAAAYEARRKSDKPEQVGGGQLAARPVSDVTHDSLPPS